MYAIYTSIHSCLKITKFIVLLFANHNPGGNPLCNISFRLGRDYLTTTINNTNNLLYIAKVVRAMVDRCECKFYDNYLSLSKVHLIARLYQQTNNKLYMETLRYIIGNTKGMENVYCIVYYTYIYFIIYI